MEGSQHAPSIHRTDSAAATLHLSPVPDGPDDALDVGTHDEIDERTAREFCIQVDNEMVRAALSFVGLNGGWTERRSIGDDTFVVSDYSPTFTNGQIGSRNVLVVESSPCAARRAIRALASGSIMAAFPIDEPRFLLPALEALRKRHAMVPTSIFDLAASMPELSDRRLDILSALVAGQSNRDIAQSIYLSEASVKREIAALFQEFGVGNRLALAARASELGVHARRSRSWL